MNRIFLGSKDYQCSWCKKTFRRRVAIVNWTVKKNPNAKLYCSKKCHNHETNYKGGYITDQGYRWVRGRIEHRSVVENVLGRRLSKREHVHHINHNKTDNRIDNLLVLDIRDHGKLEGTRSKGIPKHIHHYEETKTA